MKIGNTIVSGLLLLCISCFSGTASLNDTRAESLMENEKDCAKAGKNFIIISNELKSEKLRYIEIFMNGKDFSLDKIKEIFEHFSDKFPEPKYLTLVIKTDWSQLSLSDECPKTGSSGGNEVTKYDFNYAVFNRHETTKTVRYTKALGTDHLEIIEVP